MDDFYGRDWVAHRHHFFDAAGSVIRWLGNSLFRFRGRGKAQGKRAR